MKNNFIKFFLISLLISNISVAEQFTFKTSKIELLNEGNLIYAKDGMAISEDKNLEIQAQNFEYDKNNNLLKAFNGKAYYKSDNLSIEFDKMRLDQINLISTAENNVKIIDLNKNIIIETNKIIFDKKKNLLESSSITTLKDNLNNQLIADYFLYNLNDNIIKFKNVNLKDFNSNNFKIDVAFFNTKSNKLYGKDIEVNLDNKSFNKGNEPRFKGRSLTYDGNLTEVTKGVFTTCKKNDKCPPWQLSAEKISHNKQNQIVNYKNALLKVYDIPVMYFPKFFHPDPTVERKSGFLIPTIKSSSSGNSYFSVPYFSVISQNKDLTFTPRYYSENEFLLQSEYRQENEKSSHIVDLSLFEKKNENSKTHFFYKYNKLIEFADFEEGNISLKVEKTSNDTYLRAEKLSSPLINNYNVLENTLTIDLYSSDLSINSEIKVYENLDKENTHDKYEFILPKVDIVKRIDGLFNLNGSFFYRSNNFVKSYATNILEKVNINNFIFNSNPKITKSGFYNNYDFIIKNVNSDGENSTDYQNNEKFYLSGLFQYNSSYPLIKENTNFQNILKPRMALKISPSHTKDMSSSDGSRLDVGNIYSMDRISANDTIEGGVSLTLGNDFSIFNKKSSKEIFGVKLANNLRYEENDDLAKNNQLGAKNSNFFGEILFSPNELITSKYNASTRNNLTDINYENLVTEIKINNFITTFDYLNENNTSNKSSYLTSTAELLLNESNSIKFSTRENKSSNLTEYYNLIYEYKNDCLKASVEYNKDYYDDRDIKPEENIFLKLTIIPFGETSSPNLKD